MIFHPGSKEKFTNHIVIFILGTSDVTSVDGKKMLRYVYVEHIGHVLNDLRANSSFNRLLMGSQCSSSRIGFIVGLAYNTHCTVLYKLKSHQ